MQDETCYKWMLSKTVRNVAPPEVLCNYLQREDLHFIKPNMRPPYSLYLNLVDNAVWGELQMMVYHYRSFKSVQELQESCAVARKPRDAAAVLFGLNFADNSLRV